MLNRVGTSVLAADGGVNRHFAFEQAALAILRNTEIHPPCLDATCMVICEHQPPLSYGLFWEVLKCD